MDTVSVQRIQELKNYFLQSNRHFGGSKFSSLVKPLTSEERFVLFSDGEILEQIYQLEDYEALASVFRAVPAEVQEKIWESVACQKVLLGIGNCSDQELLDLIQTKKFFNFQELSKKEKSGKFYYNATKIRALEVLLRNVKTPKIFEQLVYNRYFQMILLCSKKAANPLFDFVNVEILFQETVKSDAYSLVDNKTKGFWCEQVNNHCSKLLLPADVKTFYLPTANYTTWFYGDQKRTLGAMLHIKLCNLHQSGKTLEFDAATLQPLNLQEINVLKSDPNAVVDQQKLNEILGILIDDSIQDGTIFHKNYLDTKNLNLPIYRAIFKIVIEKTIGHPQYEEQILSYFFSLLFADEYNVFEKKALLFSLKNALLYANEDTIGDLFTNPSDLKSVFFLRFNLTARNMDYLHGMTVSQLMRINVKHVRRIVQLLYDPEQDELSDSYSKAIKMYLVFGLEKSVELLSGKYPIQKTFMDNVSRLDVSQVEMREEGKKYLPVCHEEFNRFLFVANHIHALFDEETAISMCWYYLYNHFEEIKNLCQGHVTLLQAETILKEQVNTVKYKLEPNCYRLERVLYEAGLGNKTRSTNEEVYDEMSKIHQKQIRRVTSTIPYVQGTLTNKWSYEVMRFDSAIAYVLGYRANCCIRTKDIAHNHLLHALLCENGRILLTYKPDGTIASFSPLKRNGELLIANSIEAIDKSDSSISPMVEAFEAGVQEIFRVSKETEGRDCLKVATIGRGSLRKPVGEAWPSSIPTPTIYEKEDPVYGGTDCYHQNLDVFYRDASTSLQRLKYGEVKQKYFDPRKQILSFSYDRENVLLQLKITKIIDSIRYTKWLEAGKSKESFQKSRLGYFHALFCNDDWYVIVDGVGNIHSAYLEDDPRAKKEMDATLAVINTYQNNNEDIRKLVFSMNGKKD